MKNQKLLRTSLVIVLFFAIATVVRSQDSDIEQLSNTRAVIIHKIDSLEKRLNEIDVLLGQVSGEDKLEAMISKYGKNKGKMIASGKVWTSISFEMARDSWGEPADIQRSEVSSGSTEKWNYPDGKYLYFKNGRLESWKE